MRWFGTAFLISLFWCSFVSGEPSYAPGEVIPDIRCESNSDFSYILRLPVGYDPDREIKWPVLFMMSPSGGKTKYFDRYSEGADQCGWILAMSVQSKNSNDGFVSTSAIHAMVEDLLELFPVDDERCYATGFSGGAREAFALAQKRPDTIRGVIPCGAGGALYRKETLAYGLCGSTCFNRWDMTISFDKHISGSCVLRFFPGKHQWANADLITPAMLWMNGQYLDEDGEQSEVDAFSAMLMKVIAAHAESDPVFAYERCQILAEIKDAPDAKEAGKMRKELESNPVVELYLEMLADVADFADDHFNTNVMDYENKRTTSDMQEDSQALAEKYAGTPYVDLMKGLGEATKEF